MSIKPRITEGQKKLIPYYLHCKDLKQKEVADKAGVSPGYVSGSYRLFSRYSDDELVKIIGHAPVTTAEKEPYSIEEKLEAVTPKLEPVTIKAIKEVMSEPGRIEVPQNSTPFLALNPLAEEVKLPKPSKSEISLVGTDAELIRKMVDSLVEDGGMYDIYVAIEKK